MKNSFIFTIFSFLIIYLKTESLDDFKCFEPTSNKLKVGEDIILCIHILKNNNSSNKKVGIRVKVDEYNVISLDGAYDIIKHTNDPNVPEGTENPQPNPNQKNIEFLVQISNVTSVFTSVSFKTKFLNSIILMIIIFLIFIIW